MRARPPAFVVDVSVLIAILLKLATFYVECFDRPLISTLPVTLRTTGCEAVVVDGSHVVVAHHVFATEAAADTAAVFEGSDVDVIVKDGTAFADVVAVVDAFVGRGVRVGLVVDARASPRATAPWRG